MRDDKEEQTMKKIGCICFLIAIMLAAGCEGRTKDISLSESARLPEVIASADDLDEDPDEILDSYLQEANDDAALAASNERSEDSRASNAESKDSSAVPIPDSNQGGFPSEAKEEKLDEPDPDPVTEEKPTEPVPTPIPDPEPENPSLPDPQPEPVPDPEPVIEPEPKPEPVVEPEPEPVVEPEPKFEIGYWIGFANSAAQDKGLILDQNATDCWDNPISANSSCIYLERDITARLNRYAGDEDITAVWIWYECIGKNKYLIYIGYA